MKIKTIQNTAKIHEIFVSLQGEGPFAGEKQIFFRFSKCNMACNYCDTDNSIGEEHSVDQIILNLENIFWKHEDIKGLTLTGGEPLLYPEMILEIADWAHAMGLRVFLETNGTLIKNLKQVLKKIDVVSMDIKIPSTGKTAVYWNEHKDFLNEIIREKKHCYIKMVLSEETQLSEFDKAVEIVSHANPALPLFLQPVTPMHGVKEPDAEKLNIFKERALTQLWDVRIQPQWHKYWGIR